jgi:hypothetical protein
VRCVPYHAWKLRRRLAVEDWRRRGGIAAAGGLVPRRRCPRVERWHGDARLGEKLGKAEAAEGEREEAVAAKKGGATSACGRSRNGPRASRGLVAG